MTTTDLRSTLFDEIRTLRAGESTPQQAMAVSKLATNIINTAMLDLAAARIAARIPEEKETLACDIIPMSLTANKAA